MIQHLLGAFQPWSNETKMDETIESFNLSVALRSFHSTNLEKSLRGLKYIKKLVSRASVKEEKTIFSTFGKLAKGKDEKESELKSIDPK